MIRQFMISSITEKSINDNLDKEILIKKTAFFVAFLYLVYFRHHLD